MPEVNFALICIILGIQVSAPVINWMKLSRIERKLCPFGECPEFQKAKRRAEGL